MVLRGSNLNRDKENHINKYLAGGISGGISRTILAPLDRIKIIMQTNDILNNSYKISNLRIYNVLNILKKNDGIKGLWKGNLINCIRIIPHSGIQFGTYYYLKSLLHSENKIPYFNRLMMGSTAGLLAATVTHPIDLIRIRLQTEKNITSITDGVKNIYKENGLSNFYKGYRAAICSIVPFIGLNFATYDYIITNYKVSNNNSLNVLISGGIAGIFSQSVCYPLDTIRRRSEINGVNYKNMANSFKTIYNKNGIKGFYKGMGVNALKIIPNNFLRFIIFDYLKNFVQ